MTGVTGLVRSLADPLWASVALTLVHTLWQAGLAAAGLWLVLRRLGSDRAHIRYGLSVAALAAVPIMAAATWSVLTLPETQSSASRQTAALPGHDAPAGRNQNGGAGDPNRARAAAVSGDHRDNTAVTGALVIVWVTGAAAMLAVNTARLLSAGRLRRRAAPLTDPAILALLARLRERINLRRAVALLTLADLPGPAVVGILRPAVLLPLSVLSELPVHELEAILAHELAHIRRHDYLINVGQLVVESLLFFNPLVWWMSRRIRQEREACCDVIAVEATGRPTDYAQTLVRWAQRWVEPGGAAAAAFAGSGGRGHLLERVRRLVVPHYRPSAGLSPAGVALMLCVSAVAGTSVWQGTQTAVVFAARILSPHERARKIEQLAQEHDLSLGLDATNPDRGRIQGRVRWASGATVEGQVEILAVRHLSPLSGNYMVPVKDGVFDSPVTVGPVALLVSGPGFAPVLSAMHTVRRGETVEGIEVVVTPGRRGVVEVVDEAGRPVAGAVVTAGAEGFGVRGRERHTAGADGRVGLVHVGEVSYRIEAVAPGFSQASVIDPIAPDAPLVVRLTRASPIAGIVVDDAGKPVPATKVRIVGRSTSLGTSWGSILLPQEALTGGDGRFTIDHTARDVTYRLLVDPPNLQKQVLTVRPGGPELRVQAGPRNEVTGRVISGLDKLPVKDGKPRLPYGNALWINGRVFHYEAVVTVRDGVGHFTIRNLLPTQLSIPLAQVSMGLAGQLPAELVLDLDSSAAPEARRTIIIRLRTPPDVPPANGPIHVSAFPRNTTRPREQLRPLLVNNETRVEVTAPGRLSVTTGDLPGYWFKPIVLQEIEPGPPLLVELETEPAGVITGRVLPPPGLPLPRSIYLSAYEYGARGPIDSPAHADADGRFMITPLRFDRDYIVTAHSGMFEHVWVSEPIHVDTADPTREIVVPLAAGVSAEVQLLDPSGKPLPNVELGLSYLHAGGRNGGRGMHTDAHGRYRFEHLTPDCGDYLLSAMPREDFAGTTVPLRLDGRTTVIRLRPGVVLEGVVLDDATGLPLPNIRVDAVTEDAAARWIHYRCDMPTGASGRFRMTNLPDEPVKLQFYSQEWTWTDAPVGPVPPGSGPLTVRLSKAQGHAIQLGR